MCGIYGQVERFTPEQLQFLDKQLMHRGPDERRWREYAHISFFHARLSIVDAEGGAQPMETERYVIVFNGEIYNHMELRKQFGLKGKTRSDTETLLLLYEQKGVEMLPYLDGMFAFAIYDKQSGEVVLVRDRMGEKPLYYLHDERRFCFASELNTLSGISRLDIRQAGVVQFLVCGWIGPEETVYEKVLHVLPGHYIRVKRSPEGIKAFEHNCWWNYRDEMLQIPRRSKRGELTEELFELLKTSIKSRVESSDLPVGCFLSGGLDSSIIASLASFIKAPLPTYTFVFEDEFNEGPRATILAKRIRTQHYEIPVNYDHVRDDIGKILMAYGEPFCDDSAIPSFYIAREAKKLNTVIINGDGGDELFGGYRRYVPLAWPEPVKQIINGLSSSLMPLLPAPQKKISRYNYLYRLAKLSRYKYPDKYLAATTDLFYESQLFITGHDNEISHAKTWINDQFIKQPTTYNLQRLSELRQFMLTDINSLLPVVLLKKVDISTMQNSLESRTVFFSPQILKMTGSLSDNNLIKGNQTKFLLRRLAKKLLPEGMSKLPKRGFEAPLVKLVESNLNPLIKDYLLGRPSKGIIHDVIPIKNIEQLLNNTIPFSSDRRSKMIYTLFALEYWYVNR